MISSKGCSFKMFSASSCTCYKSRSILAKVSVTLVTLPAKSLENPGSNLGFPGHWLGSWVLSDGQWADLFRHFSDGCLTNPVATGFLAQASLISKSIVAFDVFFLGSPWSSQAISVKKVGHPWMKVTRYRIPKGIRTRTSK